MFSPTYIYNSLDQFSRDFLFYFSDHIGFGLGTSILIVSAIIKIVWGPTIILTQQNFIKMK